MWKPYFDNVIWQHLNDYDSETNKGSGESCQPIPNLVKRGTEFYIHLTGLVSESEVKIVHVDEKILILGSDKKQTFYRRFK